MMIGLLSSFGAFLVLAIGVLIFVNVYGSRIKREVQNGTFVSKEMKKKLKAEGKSVKAYKQELLTKRKEVLDKREEDGGNDSSSYLDELKSLDG